MSSTHEQSGEIRRQAILVLGMHRSGTSSMAGVLGLLGAEPPKTLIQGDTWNPRGYWESDKLGRFHDRILTSAGSAWSDWSEFDPMWIVSRAAQNFHGELRGLIKGEFGDTHLFVVKDPRICRFLPFWLRGLESLHIAPKIVFPLRNPLEVAQSLERRDGITITEGLLLWLRHCLDAEAATRGLPRSFQRFEALLDDWRGVARKIGDDLDIAWPAWTPESEAKIDAFLTRELRHNVASWDELSLREDVFAWVKETYECLLALAEGGSDARAKKILAQLDDIRHAFNEASGIFATLVARHRGTAQQAKGEAKGLGSELETSRKQIGDLREALQRSDAALAEARRQAEALRKDVAEQGREVAALHKKVGELETKRREEASEATRKAGEQREALQRSDAALAEARRHEETQRKDVAAGVREIGRLQERLSRLDTDLAGAKQQEESLRADLSARDANVRRLEAEAAETKTALEAERAGRAAAEAEAARLVEAYREFDDPAVRSLARAVRRSARLGRRMKELATLDGALPGRRRQRRHKLRLARDAELIAGSGLFDREWYLRTYPDVAAAGEDPLIHYLRHGVAERRNPNALFDTDWYLRQYPDVAAAGLNPLVHYVARGAAEKRDPGPDFSATWYLDRNPDVAEAGVDPILHYASRGSAEGRLTSVNKYTTRMQRRDHNASIKLSPAADERNATIVCTLGGAGFPDLFSLRASVVLAPRLIIAHVRHELEMARLETVLNRIDVDFDLIVTQPSGRNSTEAQGAPEQCRKRAITIFPDSIDPAQALLHIVNSDVIFDYERICWINCGIETAPETGDDITALWSDDGRKQPGLASASFCRPPKDQLPGISRALGIFTARIGRKRPTTIDLCATGGAVAISPLLLHQLRAYRIQPAELSSEAEPNWVLTALLATICDEAGMSRAALNAASTETASATIWASPTASPVKSIAFYLPQFHPIPENDRWWGKGFTEWTNVTKGRPVFRFHYQPCLPADLGFYDLRNPETQLAQAKLARDNGVYGFCYYYYWFNGRKLLNRPIEQMVKSGAPDFPFCVCWANENWSRNWDGQNRHVLIEQSYSMESSRALIREFISMMRDPRYIRHNGKPVLLVYRIRVIPNWLETAKMWRDECRRSGIGEIHLCAVRFGLEPLDGDPSIFGVDAYVMFPPHESERVDARGDVHDLTADFDGTIFSYDAVVEGDIARFSDGYPWPVHRGLMLGWDNTARRPRDSRIFLGATPARFHYWLQEVIAQNDRHKAHEENLVFINAWNEWAEGTTLEPSTRFGRGYLEAVRSVLRDRVPGAKFERTLPIDFRASPDGATAPVQSYDGEKNRLPGAPSVLVCAHVVSDKLFGGERSFIDMLDALAQLKLNVFVALPTGNHTYYTKLAQERSVRVFVVPYRQWRNDRDAEEPVVQAFCNLIDEHSIDVVYANTIVLLEPLYAARLTNRIPVIHARELITHDIELTEQIGLSPEEIVRRVFEHSSYVVANSCATEKVFHRDGVTFCAPNVVDPQALDLPNRPNKSIIFGIVSSNIPKKGIADFIEVARLCENLAPNARFLVIGPENAHVKQWKFTAPKNLTFAGYSESPQAAMAQVNVVLSLSHFAESFGRTVAEALVSRRPVVAYDWGAVGELIDHGVTGFLAPHRDIEKIAQYVVQLCRDPQLVQTMGEAGRQFILKHNTPATLRDNLWDAFQKILKRKLEMHVGERPATIVVPIHNAPDDVERCLESLTKTVDFNRDRVLMIDDASTDPHISKLLAEYGARDGFHLLINTENVGYTGTINRGIRWAGEDDVVLLNSDTITVAGWLDGLRRAAFCQANVGTVTAMSDNAGAFSFPVFDRPNPKPINVSHDDHAAAILRRTSRCEPVEVPTGSGFCMYIRREILDRIGFFDEETFPRGYGEENDFCMRALEVGWKNLISPYAYVFHARSASFGSEKAMLIESAVDKVTRRYPDYARRVKQAFSSPEMIALRAAATAELSARP